MVAVDTANANAVDPDDRKLLLGGSRYQVRVESTAVFGSNITMAWSTR